MDVHEQDVRPDNENHPALARIVSLRYVLLQIAFTASRPARRHLTDLGAFRDRSKWEESTRRLERDQTSLIFDEEDRLGLEVSRLCMPEFAVPRPVLDRPVMGEWAGGDEVAGS